MDMSNKVHAEISVIQWFTNKKNNGMNVRTEGSKVVNVNVP